ncbi:hypothetical protein AVEN_88672-1 [Araneus ventricosus]|uniref:Uncharacterized protein n=1 Tax=Araneus ventricosus TaxID=182803 RepID=A0A4Y2JJ30_ARAVE|nr:hypothetical protein AVEN_88672-1 [Araneus ventricosus]
MGWVEFILTATALFLVAIRVGLRMEGGRIIAALLLLGEKKIHEIGRPCILSAFKYCSCVRIMSGLREFAAFLELQHSCLGSCQCMEDLAGFFQHYVIFFFLAASHFDPEQKTHAFYRVFPDSLLYLFNSSCLRDIVDHKAWMSFAWRSCRHIVIEALD